MLHDKVAASPMLSIRLEGAQEAIAKSSAKRKALLGAMYDSLDLGGLRLRGRIVESFGKPGFPRRGTGRYSRGIRKRSSRSPFGARVVVGVEAKVPYARILEFGGTQPARDIHPKTKKALRWVTGATRLGMLSGLDFGLTRKQAFRSGKKFRKSDVFQAGDVHFFRPSAKKPAIHQPARHQRAIPVFGPSLNVEQPAIEKDLRARLARALAG